MLCGRQVVSRRACCCGICGTAGSRRARRVPSWWAECRLITKLVRRSADTVQGCWLRQQRAGRELQSLWVQRAGDARGERDGRRGWLQVTPAVGRSGGSPRDTEQGHSPPAGLAARFALGGAPLLILPCPVSSPCRRGKGTGLGTTTCPSSGRQSLLFASCFCLRVCISL